MSETTIPRAFSRDRDLARSAGSKGGSSPRRAPQTRHFANPEKAAAAGRIGGASIPREKRSFAANRELAREAGRKGGQAKRHVAKVTEEEVQALMADVPRVA